MKNSFYAKIGLLIVALGGVFYIINMLDSGAVTKRLTDPNSSLGLLLGSDLKPHNWCPANTVEVEVFDDSGKSLKTVSSAVDISAACEIMVGSFSNEGIDEANFIRRLAAKGKDGQTRVLEHIPEKPIFRVQGLPFSSPMLLKNIANISRP